MNKPKKKRRGWRIIRDSSHVMRVYFVDGAKRTFYSRDWRHAYSRNKDPSIGFWRYRKLVRFFGQRARTILIYHRKSNTLVAKYRKGEEVHIEDEEG